MVRCEAVMELHDSLLVDGLDEKLVVVRDKRDGARLLGAHDGHWPVTHRRLVAQKGGCDSIYEFRHTWSGGGSNRAAAAAAIEQRRR